MCGRYVLKGSALELQREFHLDQVPALTARYNIAPHQAAPIILDEAPRSLVWAQWGLLPPWAKSAKIAHKLINARSETLSAKPAFKKLLPSHRCLIPCDGFYEWRRDGARRVPYYVCQRGGGLLAMAGLWNLWQSPDGPKLHTFTIITAQASAPVQAVHDRMPVFLDREGRQRWLSGPTNDLRSLEALLRPWHGSELSVSQVAQHVNSVAVDDERCLEPPESEQLRLL